MTLALEQDPQIGTPQSLDAQAALRCVWRSHPHNDCGCTASIPHEAVLAAWHQAQAQSEVAEGFFRFSWGGGEWLGYGLGDGRVRGIYCPAHREARDARRAATLPDLAVRRTRPLTLVE
jgi:hypothetical protein